MSTTQYLFAFLLCIASVRATICATVYPGSSRCHPNYAVEESILTTNLGCGVCTSLRSLRNQLLISENNSVAAVKFHNDGKDDYDVRVNCAAGTVDVFQSRTQSARCSGEYVTRYLGDCIRAGDDSIQFGTTQCNYTFIVGGVNNFVSDEAHICGAAPYVVTYDHLCDECLEMPTGNVWFDYNYIRTSCATGRSTLYSDIDCTDPLEHFDINECKSYRSGSTVGTTSLRVLPKTVSDSTVCQGIFSNDYCGGSPSWLTSVVYLDEAAACGACYSTGTYEISIWFNSLGTTTTERVLVSSFAVDCYTGGVALYSSATCAHETKIAGDYPSGTCIRFDSFSLWAANECPTWYSST